MVICRKANVRTDEGTGKLCHELFQRIACIAKPGLAEIAIEAGFMTRSMGGLLGKRCPILTAIAKGLAKGHLDEVTSFGIERSIATMAKGNGDAREERGPTGVIFAIGNG